jgi:hypothetical protein
MFETIFKTNPKYAHLPDHQRHLKDNCYGWNCGDCLLGCFCPHFVSCYNQSTLHNSFCSGLYGLFCLDLCGCFFSQHIERTMGVDDETHIALLVFCHIFCRAGLLGREKRAIEAWVRHGKPHNGMNKTGQISAGGVDMGHGTSDGGYGSTA